MLGLSIRDRVKQHSWTSIVKINSTILQRKIFTMTNLSGITKHQDAYHSINKNGVVNKILPTDVLHIPPGSLYVHIYF